MEEKMAEMRGILRDYLRMSNIKRATVIKFGKLITPSAGQSPYLQEEEIWGADPVHYTPKGYSLAAAGLEALVYEMRSEEREEESKGGPNPAKKPRLDLSKNRQAWVMGSVAEAIRQDTRGQAGPSDRWMGRGRAVPRGVDRGSRGLSRRSADRGRGNVDENGRGRWPCHGGGSWP
jgi:hypothetical protein